MKALIIVLIVLVVVVVAVLVVLLPRLRSREAEKKRVQAREHLLEADIRSARAEQHSAAANEQAARAQRERAEMEERLAVQQREREELSAKAQRDRAEADTLQQRARELAPDLDRPRNDPEGDAASEGMPRERRLKLLRWSALGPIRVLSPGVSPITPRMATTIVPGVIVLRSWPESTVGSLRRLVTETDFDWRGSWGSAGRPMSWPAVHSATRTSHR